VKGKLVEGLFEELVGAGLDQLSLPFASLVSWSGVRDARGISIITSEVFVVDNLGLSVDSGSCDMASNFCPQVSLSKMLPK